MTTKKIPPAKGNRQDGVGTKLDIAEPVSARNRNTPEAKTQPPNIATLAAAGGEFTLPNRGNKQPFTVGWPSPWLGWQLQTGIRSAEVYC